MAKKKVLKEIILKKKERIRLAKQQTPLEDLKVKIRSLPPTHPFKEAINRPQQISLIAEIKKSSPSRGIIRQNFNVREIARIYKNSGARAISVLTEEDYFGGNISYINEVKSVVDLPILRKDFILEPYQVYESRAFGCDAILLISDILSFKELPDFLRLAKKLNLDVVVEVHALKDLKKALEANAEIIGINNRNLHNLKIDLNIATCLLPLIPKDKIVIVESGIKTNQDFLFFKNLEVNAILIGEAFMEASDIKKKIKEITGW